MFRLEGDVVDLARHLLDLLSRLLVRHPSHGGQDDVLQVGVHRVLVYLHYLIKQSVQKFRAIQKVPTVELRRRLGIEGVVEVMRKIRMRWFGHVERKEVDDWVSTCRNLEVAVSKVGAGQG